MSEFDKLLAELSAAAEEQTTLVKALPDAESEDDSQIQAAAEDDETETDDEAEEGEVDEDAGDNEELTKSMKIGEEEYEVVDAAALIKSLGDLSGRVEQHEGVLAKALASTLSGLKAQSELIKSLSDKVEKLGGQGRGRKTILSVVEKPNITEPLAKSEEQGMQPQEFLAKALNAQKAGKLTGGEVARAEQYLNNGLGIPADILSRI